MVVAWKLDRLSRPLRDLLTIKEQFEQAGVGFRNPTLAKCGDRGHSVLCL